MVAGCAVFRDIVARTDEQPVVSAKGDAQRRTARTLEAMDFAVTNQLRIGNAKSAIVVSPWVCRGRTRRSPSLKRAKCNAQPGNFGGIGGALKKITARHEPVLRKFAH